MEKTTTRTRTTVTSSTEDRDPDEVQTVERTEIRMVGNDDRSVVRSYNVVYQNQAYDTSNTNGFYQRDQFYDANNTDGFLHYQHSGFGSSGQAVES
ncbi:unnamed protein product, partial [Adineta steineri]